MDTGPEHLEFALRADRRAVLLVDGIPIERKTVLDNDRSRIVVPVPPSVFDADEVVVWVPEERDDALQVLVSPFEIDGQIEATADRWRIYHGEEPDAHWAAAEPIGIRLGRTVAGGDEVDLTNRLASDEPSLCKAFNEQPDALGALAHAFDRRTHGDCTLVGVDHLGLDIRSRWDVVRVPFGHGILSADAASAKIRELLDAHANSSG
ncbi:MAG: hypothetical protein AAFR96_13740 [Planctomycetota bacterium]